MTGENRVTSVTDYNDLQLSGENAEYLLNTWPTGYVGCWEIGGALGLRVAQRKRPRWVTRKLCALLLEWRWIDSVS